MNIERRMEFIVENLAALTVSQQKTERQMRGLQTLVKTGMRIVIKMQQGQRELKIQQKEVSSKIDMLIESQMRTDERIAELTAAQKRTDERFDRWLNSLNRGTNGHKKKPN
jgi:hypothetical protein